MLGKHHVLDLIAAIIIANKKGCSLDSIMSILQNLHLPGHRFVKKIIHRIPVISDVSVHYECIGNTISQIKLAYPNHKLYVIFE